jgi:protein-disulfide isomerase
VIILLKTIDAVRLPAVLTGLLAICSAAHAAQNPPLVITAAVPDPSGGTLSISGSNFGERPFVTLDLVPVQIRSSTDASIVVAAAVDTIPVGDYLLTVSRGPAPSDSASVPVRIGRTESPGPDRSPPTLTTVPIPPGNVAAATIGTRAISIEEVDRACLKSDPSSYIGLVRQLYELRLRAINSIVAEELLAVEAEARRVSVEALLSEEVPKHIATMPDAAVISLYLNLGDSARGATLEQMRPALRAWLQHHTEPELAKLNFIEELKKTSTRVDIRLEAPRVAVEHTPRDIALGPEVATIEIVAFADFRSAEYGRFARAFSKIRDTFGDRIRILFKNLPVLGPQSVAAAEAALCANAQNKFWPYHDALIASNGELMNEAATAAGLDRDRFSSCVERHEFRQVIAQANVEANRFGIQASPTFLVNGRFAPASPPFLAPYDYFKLLIEEELGYIAARERQERR